MRLPLKILIPLSFSLVVACGSGKSSDNNKNSTQGGINQNETIQADGSNIKGVYATTLAPLNKNIHMPRIGVAAVQRDGDVFSAFLKIKSGQRGTNLRQAIYTGRRCPTIKDDLNKDAHIDIQEALIAIGKIIIPLDSNVDSQLGGVNNYPMSDTMSGSYFYQATGSFDRMFADLKTPDQNEADNIVKLGPNDGLTFPGRIILLQGANEKVFFPPTVATAEGEKVHKSIPIACGVLWKVEKLPKELLVPGELHL